MAKELPSPNNKILYQGIVLENKHFPIKLNSFNLCKIRLKSGEEIEVRCSKLEKIGNEVTVAKVKEYGKSQIYIIQMNGLINEVR